MWVLPIVLPKPSRGTLWLAAMASTFATPAFSEVCDKERPRWSLGDSASGFGEIIHLINAPPGLVVLAVLAVVLLTRSLFAAIAGAVVAMFVAGMILYDYFFPFEIRQQAMEEGCIGPPWLAAALLVAIAVLMLATIRPRRNGPPD